MLTCDGGDGRVSRGQVASRRAHQYHAGLASVVRGHHVTRTTTNTKNTKNTIGTSNSALRNKVVIILSTAFVVVVVVAGRRR